MFFSANTYIFESPKLKYTIMKAFKHIQAALLFLIGATIISCNTKSQNKEEGKGITNEQPEQDSTEAQGNIIKQYVPVTTPFTHITNISSIDIHYSQADEYAVTIEGEESILDMVALTFDSNVLTVNIKNESNNRINRYSSKLGNIKVHITSPTLSCVSLCGHGSFYCDGTMKGDDMQFGLFETSTIKVDSIECNDFLFENGQQGNATFNSIAAKHGIEFYGRGNGHVTARVNTPKLVIANNKTEGLDITGHADDVSIETPDAPNVHINLE